MNAAWDGLPLNPERDGWHWVEHIETREASAWIWRAGLDDWVGMEPSEWRYLGPCLTPAEHEALVAEVARKDAALRTCLEQAEACWLDHYGANPDGSAVPEHIAAARAALAKEPGA